MTIRCNLYLSVIRWYDGGRDHTRVFKQEVMMERPHRDEKIQVLEEPDLRLFVYSVTHTLLRPHMDVVLQPIAVSAPDHRYFMQPSPPFMWADPKDADHVIEELLTREGWS